ncbi:hypothetical protein [Thermococcus camini]|nr:hypothetical protein [Thermococcus camini]
MRRLVVVVLAVLLVLSGLPQTTGAVSETQNGGGIINPFFERYLNALQNATPEERRAILTLMEALLNGTLNGEMVISENMRIRNAHWNGTNLIFQIWWYNGTEPTIIKTYLWRNPRRALEAIQREKESSTYSVQSTESINNEFKVELLSTSSAVQIIDVDYLTNDGTGEYTYLYNPSSISQSLEGWHLLDDYAYGNPSCWMNSTPKEECTDAFGRDHSIELSSSAPPYTPIKILIASSPESAILNNDGDVLYLIDRWGNVISRYQYQASPEIAIEGITIQPDPPIDGEYMSLTLKLDNRGALDGTGTIEVYVDGTLVKTERDVSVRKYSIRYYNVYGAWTATPGNHTLVVKFVPDYNGETATIGKTFHVDATPHPYISEVRYNTPVMDYPLRFNITAKNPTDTTQDIQLTLLVDGAKVDEFSRGFIYAHNQYDGFYLIWSRPTAGYHNFTIIMTAEDGSTSEWSRKIYVRPNSPPRIESVEFPGQVYANDNNTGQVYVYDPDGDTVNVWVNVGGRFSFLVPQVPSGESGGFYLVLYSYTNCRENVTVEFAPVDKYGKTGETYRMNVTVIADSDRDGWCNAEDIEPFTDATVTVYIFRYRELDAVSGDVSLKAFTLINGKYQEVYNSQLAYMTTDYEKRTLLRENIFSNIDEQAIAKFTFDIPDNAETVDLWLNLNDGENVLDISPTSSPFAHIVFNTLTGTWSGDDYPNDHKEYFGYGHLSGCGDGSCGDINPSTDIEPFSKYYDELEALGYDLSVVNITNVQGWDGIESLELRDHKSGILYRYTNPEEAVLFTLSLPNGTHRKVLIINKRNAKVRAMKLNEEVNAMSTGGEGNGTNVSNVTTNATARIGKGARYEATLIFRNETENVKTLSTESVSSSETSTETSSLTFDAVATSTDVDEDDAEIWFLIKLNDADGDGIPFHRELELNKELGTNKFSPTSDDTYYDYDGDGVPNSVELFIGKDPAKRDILGIELNISVEWTMSEEDKKNLIYSIRRASDFIYDYTDGYAMITQVRIWDKKRNWDVADVRVHDTTWQIPQTSGELLYPGWPKAVVGGYWMKRDPGVSPQEKAFIHIMMSEKFWGGNFWGSIGEEDWGEMLGHELGHYVFWLRDEYLDWHGHKYGEWYPAVLTEFVGPETPEIYLILTGKMLSLHTVMNKQWEWSELSTPRDYKMFRNWTYQLWQKYQNAWINMGYTTDTDMLPDQWGDPNDPDKWHSSGWETLYKILTSENLEINACVPLEDPSKGAYACRPQNIIMSNGIQIDSVVDLGFVPRTGPYTGVGYLMEVVWG